jgi:hypothetical protein
MPVIGYFSGRSPDAEAPLSSACKIGICRTTEQLIAPIRLRREG